MRRFPESNLTVCEHGYHERHCRHCAVERGEEPPPQRRRRGAASTLVYRNWKTGQLEPDCEPFPGD